ncbi:MAG TPA: hypothetical protein VN778_03610 [Verrucomicrobiae bacterium]|nr:hypothetical protein [Verrucomicrobiae bacterium]
MSLTQDDLQAIQRLIQTTVPPLIKVTVQPMIDEAVDTLAQSTAAGFAEVHERIDKVEAGLGRIENKLDATIDRIDDHATRIRQLELKAV